MTALRSLFDWAEAHRAELLDLLRIYLGVGLVVHASPWELQRGRSSKLQPAKVQ